MFECAHEVCYEQFIWEAGIMDLRRMHCIFLDQMQLGSFIQSSVQTETRPKQILKWNHPRCGLLPEKATL